MKPAEKGGNNKSNFEALKCIMESNNVNWD